MEAVNCAQLRQNTTLTPKHAKRYAKKTTSTSTTEYAHAQKVMEEILQATVFLNSALQTAHIMSELTHVFATQVTTSEKLQANVF